jgi:Ca-activated chloride channel family protein
MDGVPGPAMTGSLALPIVDAAVLATLPPDEAVSARSTELRAAALQRQARTAAQRGDWDRVDGLIDEIRKVSRGNEWILASIEPLRAYARQRDREHFAKEAQYKSMRMMYRLARRDDGAAFSAEAERDRPAFLRRKSEQGKRSEP